MTYILPAVIMAIIISSRSLKKIDHAQERALIFNLGRACDVKGPGRFWIWWPFQRALRFKTRSVPDFDELLARGEYAAIVDIVSHRDDCQEM